MIQAPDPLKAPAALTQVVCDKIATDRGLHPETAVAAAARMAGTLLLRSTRMPLSNLPPGAPVFCDGIDERGQSLLNAVGRTLACLRVPFDARKLRIDTPEENLPRLDLASTQSMLDAEFRTVLTLHRLSDASGAWAAAISAAMLIYRSAAQVDPHISYTIATYGVIEACKTVPFVS